mmetsp:Transcript_15007/g.29875  ORF Transcript_15007/g.29875 Transcript_15007/m.29875 type:complete len:134 (+) Transcript_15007:18-419(+)|eukprot:CAMPEP_0182460926 /NCGR_PEP_ID=MMETSP1319-20130603/5648_1 /TAXON_ID=172717 /ORGANISM="Bolidomonas pacifica, Strain RCC208" /LENGTH=133 /DNA_ID=CAMNT_0024660113 /DNA_START=187 /DNA_END=588 /DNA_ORIENTATION=+
MSLVSTLALALTGGLSGVYGYLFLASPSSLISAYRDSSFAVDELMSSVCKYYGATLLVVAFLTLHYIPFPEKHGPGLRLSMMLALSYCAVAAHTLFMGGSGNEEAARRTLMVQGVAFVVSFVGAKAAPKKKKD